MKKQLAWMVVAGFGVTFGVAAQTSAGAGSSSSAGVQAGPASASAVQATAVSAELQKKIDSKDAKVGDEVSAKITSEARLSDGTKLPKGSKIVGHVTDAQAKSKDNHDGHVTFAFDRAVLKDGREVPILAMMHSISAPAPVAAASGSDDMMAGAGAGSGMARGGAGGGGGLAGNGPAVRGATSAAGGVASTAGSGLGTTTSGIDGSLNGAASQNGALGAGGRSLDGAALNNAAGMNGALATGVSMPVANLSGVTFATVNAGAGVSNGGVNGSASASLATALTGHGRNVTLDSGSQMTMAVAPR